MYVSFLGLQSSRWGERAGCFTFSRLLMHVTFGCVCLFHAVQWVGLRRKGVTSSGHTHLQLL